jgi:hypothetical protein
MIRNWRSALLDVAVTILVAAIALHAAVGLIESVLPELLTVVGISTLIAVVIFIAKVRRERW